MESKEQCKQESKLGNSQHGESLLARLLEISEEKVTAQEQITARCKTRINELEHILEKREAFIKEYIDNNNNYHSARDVTEQALKETINSQDKYIGLIKEDYPHCMKVLCVLTLFFTGYTVIDAIHTINEPLSLKTVFSALILSLAYSSIIGSLQNRYSYELGNWFGAGYKKVKRLFLGANCRREA